MRGEQPLSPPVRFQRRRPDRRRGRERRGKLELPPPTWADRSLGVLKALGANPPNWLAGLFVGAAVLAWYLPVLRVSPHIATLTIAVLIVGGSIGILLYQSWAAAALERRLKAEEVDLADLRKLFKALQAKLTVVQSNLDLAISDCEELRGLNAQHSRVIAEFVAPGGGAPQQDDSLSRKPG
jgi:hypothetical protein